jgi:hypothetical protein
MSSLHRTASAQPLHCYMEMTVLDSIIRKTHSSAHDNEQLSALYTHSAKKSTWHARCLAPLPCQLYGNEQHTYKFNKQMDYAEYPVFRQTLPEVSTVDPSKYRIRYCQNPAHNAAIELGLEISDMPIQKINSHIMDAHHQHFHHDDYDGYDWMIGNRPELQTWTNKKSPSLPATYIKSVPPFTFARHKKTSLHMCSMEHNEIQFKCRFRTNVHELIQCQELVEETDDEGNVQKYWQWVEKDRLPTIIKTNKPKLDPCEVYLKYVMVTEEEKVALNKKRDVLIQQFGHYTSSRCKSKDGYADVPLSCNFPATYLIFFAENQRALDYNIYSNYTTNTYEPQKSQSCITQVSMYFDTAMKFEYMPADLFQHNESLREFGGCARQPGYHCMATSADPHSVDPCAGCSYAKIGAKMRYHFEQKKDEPEDDEDVYVVHTIAAMMSMYEVNGKTVTLSGTTTNN